MRCTIPLAIYQEVAALKPSPLTKCPCPLRANSFFKTLIDQSVTVELKNDIKVTGTLKSVDQYLNIKLDDISVHEELRYPHLSAVKNVFIRGSVVRYVHLPASAVDVTLLEDAARRGGFPLFTLLPRQDCVIYLVHPHQSSGGGLVKLSC